MVDFGRWSISGVTISVWAIDWDRNKVIDLWEVDLWRWSVREVLLYSKTSINRPTMGPTFSGRFREMIGLGSSNVCMGDRLGPK